MYEVDLTPRSDPWYVRLWRWVRGFLVAWHPDARQAALELALVQVGHEVGLVRTDRGPGRSWEGWYGRRTAGEGPVRTFSSYRELAIYRNLRRRTGHNLRDRDRVISVSGRLDIPLRWGPVDRPEGVRSPGSRFGPAVE